jgi:hypothetical protein
MGCNFNGIFMEWMAGHMSEVVRSSLSMPGCLQETFLVTATERGYLWCGKGCTEAERTAGSTIQDTILSGASEGSRDCVGGGVGQTRSGPHSGKGDTLLRLAAQHYSSDNDAVTGRCCRNAALNLYGTGLPPGHVVYGDGHVRM